MKLKIAKYIIFVFVLILSFNCEKRIDEFSDNSEAKCENTKSELLINEIIGKKHFFPLINSFYDKDSSLRYNYIYAKNFLLTKNEYYARVRYSDAKITFDSLKLKVTTDRNAFYMDANMLTIKLKSTNSDTTEVSMQISYGLYNNQAMNWSDYIFVFDSSTCKWNVKDSVFNEY